MQTKYRVSGMSCSHCIKAVEDEVHETYPEAVVSVTLNPSRVSIVIVSRDEDMDENVLANAIVEAGYSVAR